MNRVKEEVEGALTVGVSRHTSTLWGTLASPKPSLSVYNPATALPARPKTALTPDSLSR